MKPLTLQERAVLDRLDPLTPYDHLRNAYYRATLGFRLLAYYLQHRADKK
jgi:hypothetical protein